MLHAFGTTAVVVALLPSIASAASEVFTTSGTWTNPGGVTEVTVTLVGGGGGGAGSRTASSVYYGGGGGGGGGSTSQTVSVSGDVTVTIGAGGAGGAVDSNGSSGGDTTFGALATADGGGGGGRPDKGSAGAAGTGGYAGGIGGGGGANTNRNNSGGGGGGGAWAGAGSNGGDGGSSGAGSCVTGVAGGTGGAGGTSNPNTGTGGDGGEGDNSTPDTPGETYGGGGGGAGNNANCVGEGTGTWAGSDGADGYLLVEWDSTAPTPNPMTFATAPDDASATSIDMTATTASDPLGGIEYQFDFEACSSDGGDFASDSGWQSGTTYTDTGLEVNQCYGYRVRARDANQNTTSYSSAVEAYTAANTPGKPLFIPLTQTTAKINNDENGNPLANPATTFAAQIVNSSPNDVSWEDMYIDTSGNATSTAVWMTDSQLESLTISGLTSGTSYAVQVKARNGDNDETSFSTASDGSSTLGSEQRTIRLTGNVRLRGVRLR